MNTDIRLSVDFFNHPKTIKLMRRLGADGVICLQRLWLFAARHKCDGRLSDMDAEEICIAAGYNDSLTNRTTSVNGPISFVDTLVELRWLDVVDGVYCLHGWLDRNGYAASADDRSDKSRFSRLSKTHNVLYLQLKSQGYTAISAEEFRRLTAPFRVNASTICEANPQPEVNESFNGSLTDRSSPLPSPLPSPTKVIATRKSRIPSGDHQLFIAWWCMAFEKVFEQKATIDGKNAKLIQKMLKDVDGVKRLVAFASIVLTSDDQFYNDAGRTIGVLSSQLEAFKSRKNNYDLARWRECGIAPPDGTAFEDWKFWEVTD